jgi:hypothetical protein
MQELLRFVFLVLWSLTPHDAEDVPGLADLPDVVADETAAVAAADEADNPVGAPPETPADGAEAPPVDAPTVDTSDAPEAVDLSGVPAAVDEAGVPEDVELPEQAGGDVEAPPADVPPADAGACAAEAHGPEATDCAGA